MACQGFLLREACVPVLVLGDNRNNSEDSRSGNIGMVKRTQIAGKAWLHLGHEEEGIGFIE